MAGRFSQKRTPEEGVLEYEHAENYDFRSNHASARELRCLVVWGGMVANCAEDDLSQLVDESAEVLQSVLYCPTRTKGGALIRPKYHVGDRGGKVTFPVLTDLSIRLSPVLLPRNYGWLCPNLLRLRLLCVVERGRSPATAATEEVRLPFVKQLKQWMGEKEKQGLAQQMLVHCPRLESITFSLCQVEPGCGRKERDWITLLPPMPISWEVKRLLLLPIVKVVEDKETQEDAGNGGDGQTARSPSSPLSVLTLQLVQMVFSFLGRGGWEHQRSDIPSDEAESLGLPPRLCTMMLDELLSAASL